MRVWGSGALAHTKGAQRMLGEAQGELRAHLWSFKFVLYWRERNKVTKEPFTDSQIPQGSPSREQRPLKLVGHGRSLRESLGLVSA